VRVLHRQSGSAVQYKCSTSAVHYHICPMLLTCDTCRTIRSRLRVAPTAPGGGPSANAAGDQSDLTSDGWMDGRVGWVELSLGAVARATLHTGNAVAQMLHGLITGLITAVQYSSSRHREETTPSRLTSAAHRSAPPLRFETSTRSLVTPGAPGTAHR